MFRKIYVIIKRLILSVLFIYGYNKLALPLNMIIPINVITVGMITLFGIPSVLMLILFSIVFI